MTLVANDDPSCILYTSTFCPETGFFLRTVRKKGPYSSKEIRSPSPELIDIAITNKCGFGCEYCYQDSVPNAEHGRKDLVRQTLLTLKHIPYQIAIGGGEPTIHPNFLEILQEAKDLGTVPNYTTAGHNISDELINITNKTCGGMAITFHAFKGKEWFNEKYNILRKKIKIQLNIHLIVDKNIIETLPFIINLQKTVGNINLILLAYYPEVGRATLDKVLTKNIYMRQLPELIHKAHDSGINLSFSEGLLPFFLSRPELPINTQMATRTEGLYSCYIDHNGRMSQSSFDKWKVTIYPKYSSDLDEETRFKRIELARNYSNVFGVGTQNLWESLHSRAGVSGDACGTCKHNNKCATPSSFHYFCCAYASHNVTKEI